MPYPMPSVPPRVMTVFTAPSRTPLASKQPYHYVGYFGGVLVPTGAAFSNAPVTAVLALRTGVRFPYATLPVYFKV